jgi:hypothetical protein
LILRLIPAANSLVTPFQLKLAEIEPSCKPGWHVLFLLLKESSSSTNSSSKRVVSAAEWNGG